MSGSAPFRPLLDSPPAELPQSIRPTPGAFGHALARLQVHFEELRRRRLSVPRLERRRLEREQMREQRRGRRRANW